MNLNFHSHTTLPKKVLMNITMIVIVTFFWSLELYIYLHFFAMMYVGKHNKVEKGGAFISSVIMNHGEFRSASIMAITLTCVDENHQLSFSSPYMLTPIP